MTELLAVLTAIFVVYALYEVFATVSQSGDGLNQTVADGPAAPQTAPPKQPVAPAVSMPHSATVATTPTRQATSVEDHEKHNNLRNPVTGEVSPTPGNYRFAKKWIKEAMVAEGLLPKVYKNSELTETLNLKAKAAIEKFKHLEKYHA
jgi:hypothetical protein